MQPPLLFFNRQQTLDDVLRERLGKALTAVERLDAERLLATPDVDILEALITEWEVEPPFAHEDQRYTPGVKDAKLDVTGRWEYSTFPDRRTLIDASEISLHVPISGFGPAFTCNASTRSLSPPVGQIGAREIVLSQTLPAHEVQSDEAVGEKVRRNFDDLLRQIQQLVGYARNDCDSWNVQLRQQLESKIAGRKQKLLADRNLEAALGIELTPRSNPPVVAINLEQRRKLNLTQALRQPGVTPFAPEPEVVDGDYRRMIELTLKWSEGVERLPDTYGPMDEEALRDSLLIVLNGQFQWTGGEVFQRKGKTDIVVPYMHNDRTAMSFIAELKFWSGPKNFTRAVDQLLGYTTWRNTKTMLVALFRNKDTTPLIATARETLHGHEGFKRSNETIGEGGELATLAHPEDSTRELLLALVPVVVPRVE